jgi:hypothetical protein
MQYINRFEQIAGVSENILMYLYMVLGLNKRKWRNWSGEQQEMKKKGKIVGGGGGGHKNARAGYSIIWPRFEGLHTESADPRGHAV